MKHLLAVVAVMLLIGCSSVNLPPKQCGDAGYSHTVNFAKVARIGDMCKYAYKTDEEIKEKYYKFRTYIKLIKDIDVKYMVLYDDMMNRQYVVIRGTASLKNAKIDGSYKKVENNKLSDFASDVIDQTVAKDEKLEIYVHKGFNTSTKLIYADMVENKVLENRYSTTVTGHSLGGAIAVLIYLNLYVDGADNLDMLYTFGQPKTLTKKGVLKYRCIPCIRFVNEDDLVPCVPPSKFAFGLFTSIPLWRHGTYYHLGDEVILLKDSNYVYLEYHDAERLDVTSFWKKMGNKELSVSDHSMDLYVENMKLKKDVITEQQYDERKKFK